MKINPSKWKRIGNVHVDEGALMIGDPCWQIGFWENTYHTWNTVCDTLDAAEKAGRSIAEPFGATRGAVFNTGGNGVFNLYGRYNEHGNLVAVMVAIEEECVNDNE